MHGLPINLRYIYKRVSSLMEKRKYRKSKVISLFVVIPPAVLRSCRETERGWAGLGVMGAGMGCPGIPEAEDASQEKAKLFTDVSMHCYERNWQTVGVKVWNSMHLAKSSNICTIYHRELLLCGKLWDESFPAQFAQEGGVARSVARVRRQDEKCRGWGFPLGIPRAKGRGLPPPLPPARNNLGNSLDFSVDFRSF